MPIYEYKCLDCEAHFEKLQKATDEPLKICETCGGNLEKQWSLSGFQFKGEGWYVTDYAKDKNKKSGESEKKSKAESTESSKKASNKTGEKSKTTTKKVESEK